MYEDLKKKLAALETAPDVTMNKIIEKAIRWRMTHCEEYAWEGRQEDVSVAPIGKYEISFVQRYPKGLSPKSAEYQEKLIGLATEEAIKIIKAEYENYDLSATEAELVTANARIAECETILVKVRAHLDEGNRYYTSPFYEMVRDKLRNSITAYFLNTPPP